MKLRDHETHMWTLSTFFLAGFLWLLSRNGPRMNVGYIDPNIYVGLARAPEQSDILSSSYYSSRVVHISVLRLLNALFSSSAPQAYSILVFGGTASLIFLIFSAVETQPRSASVNMLGAVLLAFLPTVWLAASWTYVNGTLWLLLLIVVNCVLRAQTKPSEDLNTFYVWVAGLASILAINTHPKSLLLLAAIFGSLSSLWGAAKTLRAAAFGLASGYALTEIVYQILEAGRLESAWNAQVRFALRLAGAQGEWRSLVQQWSSGTFPHHFFAPLILAGTCLVLLKFPSREWDIRAAILAKITVFGALALLLHQEVLRDPLSTTFWYYSPYGLVVITGVSVIFWHYPGIRFLLISFLAPLYLHGVLSLVWPAFAANRGSKLWVVVLVLGVGLCRVIFQYMRHWRIHLKSPPEPGSCQSWRSIGLAMLALVSASLSLWLATEQVPSWAAPPSGAGSDGVSLSRELYVDQGLFLEVWVAESESGQAAKIWYRPDQRGYLGALHASLLFVPTSLTLGAWPEIVSAASVRDLLNQTDSWNTSVLFLALLDDRRPETLEIQRTTLLRVRRAFAGLGCTSTEIDLSGSKVEMLKFECGR